MNFLYMNGQAAPNLSSVDQNSTTKGSIKESPLTSISFGAMQISKIRLLLFSFTIGIYYVPFIYSILVKTGSI